MQRGFLSEDPLNGLAPFDTTPMTIRRAMPLEEIDALLRAAPESRRLLYETAIVSGLRANELRNLTINHLDDEPCGLRLDATWTKNRKPGFQPLPRALMDEPTNFRSVRRAKEVLRKKLPSGKS